MTPDEVRQLFVVLAGYWGALAPDPDDPVALAGHADLLREVSLEDAVAAARGIAIEDGERFCPQPGVIANRATYRKIVPPYHRPIQLEDPAEPAAPDVVAEQVAQMREAVRRTGVRRMARNFHR